MLLAITLMDGTPKWINIDIVKEIVPVDGGYTIFHFNGYSTSVQKWRVY